MKIDETGLRFTATKSSGEVNATLLNPEGAKCLLVLAHGAGVGMDHPFMETAAEKLATHRIATFRFNFPYMEKGKKKPDLPPILKKTIVFAAEKASQLALNLPMFAGGKSLGGRMTSSAAAEGKLPNVEGLVFFGFPLHAPGKPSSERANHLKDVKVPMLFLQGTRDRLAKLELLEPICRNLGDKATLEIFEGADHSFQVPKSTGKSDEEVIDEIAKRVAWWLSNFN